MVADGRMNSHATLIGINLTAHIYIPCIYCLENPSHKSYSTRNPYWLCLVFLLFSICVVCCFSTSNTADELVQTRNSLSVYLYECTNEIYPEIYELRGNVGLYRV